MDRGQKEMDYALVRYDRNSRAPTPQNSRLYSQYEQVGPYQRPSAIYAPSSAQARSTSGQGNNHRVNQNVAAVMHYSSLEKGKVIDGRQASALAQMHQNDLHNVATSQELVQYNKNGLNKNGLNKNGLNNGHAVTQPDKSKNYIKRYLNLQTKFAEAQNISAQQSPGRAPQSDLITSFDPMKDRHMWTMWRTAVNGRIVDEVRQLERRKSEMGVAASSNFDASVPGMYGKALVVPPLKRFIKIGNEESQAVADQMSYASGQGSLETSQFVYYGLPRVYVSQMRK